MCHFTCNQNDMPMHENSASNLVNLCEPCHEHKQEPRAVAQHKPYLKVLYNVYIILLMDNSMDNANMATLSMEPRKQIITLHNNYSYSISCRHII